MGVNAKEERRNKIFIKLHIIEIIMNKIPITQAQMDMITSILYQYLLDKNSEYSYYEEKAFRYIEEQGILSELNEDSRYGTIVLWTLEFNGECKNRFSINENRDRILIH